MMQRKWILTIVVAALAAAGCSGPEQAVPPKRTPVRMQIATSGPATPPITATGLVATKDEMRLSFKVGGVIKAINVQEGQEVRQGQRLAEIELTEVNAQVEQARELASKADRDLDRGERLYADQVISLEQLQDLRTQAALHRAQLQSAQFNRGYAVITAPSAAVVLRKHAEERELVPAGQSVLTIGARDNGYVVRAALSDREIVQLKIGDSAQIRMDAYPGQALGGTLVEIASAAEEKSGLFAIEVRIDAVPVPLVSGLVAKLSLIPHRARTSQLTYVPISAVVEGDGNRASVFVVSGERARRRDVNVAFIHADSVALVDGLEAGEPVVTDGALYLEENELIEVLSDGAKVVDSQGTGTG